MKANPRFSVTALVLVLFGLLPALFWAGGAHAQTRGPAMPPPGPDAAADLAVLYHQHILAINRGDLAAVVAGYAPEAVFIGPGAPPCSVSVPCVGRDAIQGLFQGLIAAKLQAGIIDLQPSGSTLTGRLNIIHDGIRAAGFGVVRFKVTVTYAGDKIARDVVEYDTGDPATAAYAQFRRLRDLLVQHYEAVNRGDAATALAAFAEDAVLGRGWGGACQAENPCTGQEAIRARIQQEITGQARYNVIHVQASGTGLAARVEVRGPNEFAAAEIERAIYNVVASFSGEKIALLVDHFDLDDRQTAQFSEAFRVLSVTGRRAAALARRDVGRALESYADDAVFEGGFGLCAQRPCVGKEAIRREIERSWADNTRSANIPGTLRVSGDTQTNQVELRSDSITRAGVDRIIGSTTHVVRGNRIVLSRQTLDEGDPQTARFLAAQVPARLPATGNGGLADERTTGEPGP